MSRPFFVLIVDDEPFNIDLLRQELEAGGHEVATALDGSSAIALAEAAPPDVILLDVMMPNIDGFEVCRRLKASSTVKDVPVVFMTALAEIEDKVKAFEAGGVDYITKPFALEELLARVATHAQLRRTTVALNERNRRLEAEIEANRRARQTIEYLEQEIQSELRFSEIMGDSPGLNQALALVEQVAGTDATVLVSGETGSGKELFARALHQRSRRCDGPLIKVNCAALPADLVESELFGHEQGAFTGATQRRKGRFELADGGTLFLDEVGELSAAAQAKLLRVLQEQEIERVGGSQTISVDVRVVAATNRDLEAAVHSGTFRADLYYRLNVFPIEVPPLRERPSDVAVLARHFMSLAAARLGKRFEAIEPTHLEALERYAWPGNVRELQNIIERAVILSSGHRLQIDEGLVQRPQPGTATISTPGGGTLEDIERTYIEQVLVELDWVVEGPRGAASRLGLNPSTLRGRMRKLGIGKRA